MPERCQDRERDPVPGSVRPAFPALGGPVRSPGQLSWPPEESVRSEHMRPRDMRPGDSRPGDMRPRDMRPRDMPPPDMPLGDMRLGDELPRGARLRDGMPGTRDRDSSNGQRFDWLLDAAENPPLRADGTFFPKSDGAPAASMPGLAGRFAAEWCPTGTSLRRTALQRVRGRTDGGVMVRRALLDRGDLHQADDEALPLSRPFPARPDAVATHWRGAGGRWLVWVARAIAWAVILLIGYRGVLAIIDGRASDTAASSAVAGTGTQFPVTMAEAYALQFGDVYLNFSPATAAARSHELGEVPARPAPTRSSAGTGRAPSGSSMNRWPA